MPLRLVRSWEPTRLLNENWNRPEPYASAGYVPDDVTLLNGNAIGDSPWAQPATVHRDLGANWTELWSRWDITAGSPTNAQLRSAPLGRVPRTTARGASPKYDGTLPAGCPAEFYGSLLKWNGPVPAEGFVVDVFGLDQPLYHDNWLLFRFDPVTGTGYGKNGRGGLYYFSGWVPEVTPFNAPTVGDMYGHVRIVCADDYQGLFWLGPWSVNGSPVSSLGPPKVPRQVWEGTDARMNGSGGGIYIWCDDGRYEDPDTGIRDAAAQLQAHGVAREVNVWELPATLPARFRSTLPAGYTMRWVSDNMGNDANALIAEDLGTGAQVAAPAYLGTWEFDSGAGFERIEVDDAGASTIYVEPTDLKPFTVLAFGEETDFPPPTDPDTGLPTVPVTPDPDPLPEDWRNFYADFNTLTHTLEGASITQRPDAISTDYLRAHSLGPVALNDVSQGVATWVWEAWADNVTGEVFTRRENATHDGWDVEVLLFTFALVNPILELDLAFNQNGQPEVCVQRGANLWHYYYYPLDLVYRFEDFGVGRTPRVLLDNPWDTGNSDILIFYMDDVADKMRYRIQSERYVTAHDTPLRSVATAFLEDVVRTHGYRIQVIYTVHWAAIGFWQCRSFVTALYPVVMAPEGTDLVSGLSNTVWTPVILGSMVPEGVGTVLSVVPTIIYPLTPPMVAEGVDPVLSAVLLLISPILGSMIAEGVGVSVALSSGVYTPLIAQTLTPEGVNFTNALSAATLAP